MHRSAPARSHRVRSRFARVPALLACLGLLACPAGDDDDTATPTPPPCDEASPPELAVNPVADGQPVDFPVQVVAQAVDEDQGVNTVVLYYRPAGFDEFLLTFMSNEETGDETIFVAEIPGTVVREGGVDWYVEASDRGAPCVGVARLPEDAPDEYFSFSTAVDVRGLPLQESFEDAPVGGDIEDLGWTVAIKSFPQEIHAWRLDGRGPLTGEKAASHGEGIPGGAWTCPEDGGTIERNNWLITPALDFTGQEEVAVRWFERRLESGVCAELHQLYVSTGSRDPDAGDFTAIEPELPFPGSAWRSSAWYDLSAYAGEEKVYVALYYEGGSAGRWVVDDFYVGEPIADLELVEATELGDQVGPGSTGVQLLVRIANTSQDYAAPQLTATLTTADAGLTITQADSTLPALAPGENAWVDGGAFVFDVAASHPDDSYLDFAVQLDDGLGHQWTVPVRLLMGHESFVHVQSTLLAGANLELTLGHGPDLAPTWAVDNDLTAPGTTTWTVPVTERAAFLPPGPGQRRWFLRVENDGTSAATLDEVLFEVGGVQIPAAGLPLSLAPSDEALILVPPPPALVIDTFATSPDPVAPGAAVQITGLVLRNTGADTAGPVSCVMGSAHPHVSGFSSTPTTFGGSAIPEGGTAVADGAFAVTVSPDHIDDSDIPLTLICIDGQDTLTPSLLLPVPYAHPVTDSFRIDDDAGNDDGLADPSEVVDVYLTVRNDGDFATGAPVTAAVTAAGGTAAYTVASSTLAFGGTPLDPGETREADAPFELSVGGSALLGDTMILEVTYTAGADVWTEQVTIDVTGLDWRPCPDAPDAMGDPIGGDAFDISGCSYRSDDTMLQVRVESYTPFNPASQELWVFFFEAPTTWTVEAIPPAAPSLEDGCIGGDDVVPSVPLLLDRTANDSLTLRIALTDLGVFGAPNTQVAFATGFCGNPWFCDVYPDNAAQVLNGQTSCSDSLFVPINW